MFRQCHLGPNRIVHSPEGGYLRGRRASNESRRFFWVLEQVWTELGRAEQPDAPRVHIQTAHWAIGEEQPEDSGWRVDGVHWRTPPLRPLAIEFNGCYYHGTYGQVSEAHNTHTHTGCRLCFPDRDRVLAGGHTAEELYTRTQSRAWDLEQRCGFEVHHVWECEWRARLARDRRLRRMAAVASRELPGPLDLRRHALFGGRVDPFRLHYLCSEQEEIILLDIVSLCLPTTFITHTHTCRFHSIPM